MSRRTKPRSQSQPPARSQVGNTVIFSCIHGAYRHPESEDFLLEVNDRFKPSRVICLGDIIDGFTSSRYAAQAAALGADDEFECDIEFLTRLSQSFPRMDVLDGNHEARIDKRASESGIPAKRIRPLHEVPELRKPLAGWTWHDEMELGPDTICSHGEGLGGQNPGEDAVLKYRKNVIIGHLHTRAGVMHYSRGGWRNWCLHVGCLLDPNSVANGYAKHGKKRPILGAGVLLDNKYPLFVPMT